MNDYKRSDDQRLMRILYIIETERIKAECGMFWCCVLLIIVFIMCLLIVVLTG